MLPLLVLILFFMLDFGKAFNYWNDTTHLTAEAARFAVVDRTPDPSSTLSLQAQIQSQADTAELRTGPVGPPTQVCVNFPNGTSNAGDPVRVTMTFTYHVDSAYRQEARQHRVDLGHFHDGHAARGGADQVLRRMRVIFAHPMSERGGVLVMVALWLPVLVVMLTFVVDVGNWFVHKRHLQTQADAAALAAARDFNSCPNNTPITDKAAQYSQDLYNAQIGGTPGARVHLLINSKTFYNQPGGRRRHGGTRRRARPDDRRQDDRDRPAVVLPAVPALLGAVGAKVPYINAQARVSIFSATPRPARCRSACPTSTRGPRRPGSSTRAPARCLARPR